MSKAQSIRDAFEKLGWGSSNAAITSELKRQDIIVSVAQIGNERNAHKFRTGTSNGSVFEPVTTVKTLYRVKELIAEFGSLDALLRAIYDYQDITK